jgi:cytidylate kinase
VSLQGLAEHDAACGSLRGGLAGETEASSSVSRGTRSPKLWNSDRYSVARGRRREAKPAASSPRESAISGLTHAFTRRKVAGPAALEQLAQSFSNRPVILIAGHQLTGKSTVAGRLARHLAGESDYPSPDMKSLGASFRAEAERRGIDIAELSRLIASEPDLERCIDFQSALSIAKGEAPAFEGRLAGAFGALLRDLGRDRLFTVYLDCAPKERARRYLERDAGIEGSAELVERVLSKTSDGADLATCLSLLARSGSQELAAAARSMSEAAARDARDLARYGALYGIDYQRPELYDLVVDTTRLDREGVLQAIIHALPDGFHSIQ